MFCPNCGREAKDGSAYCIYCGARIWPGAADPLGAGDSSSGTGEPFGAGDPFGTGNMGGGMGQGPAGGASYAERRILGENAEYYLEQFRRIREGGKGSFHWAAFFLGLLHAGYRNMWREWLRVLGLPLVLAFVAMLLAGILSFFVSPFVIGTALLVAGLALSVWTLVAEILYARRFNRMYMRHVEGKAAENDLASDVSVGRAIGCVAALAGAELVAGIVCSGLLSVGASSYWLSGRGMNDIDRLPGYYDDDGYPDFDDFFDGYFDRYDDRYDYDDYIDPYDYDDYADPYDGYDGHDDFSGVGDARGTPRQCGGIG